MVPFESYRNKAGFRAGYGGLPGLLLSELRR